MKYLLNVRTKLSFDDLEDLVTDKCMYGCTIRLGGFSGPDDSQNKVMTLSFENKKDRETIKSLFVQRGAQAHQRAA